VHNVCGGEVFGTRGNVMRCAMPPWHLSAIQCHSHMHTVLCGEIFVFSRGKFMHELRGGDPRGKRRAAGVRVMPQWPVSTTDSDVELRELRPWKVFELHRLDNSMFNRMCCRNVLGGRGFVLHELRCRPLLSRDGVDVRVVCEWAVPNFGGAIKLLGVCRRDV